MIEITHKANGQVILRLEASTLEEAAEAGLLERADLRDANLRGWDLTNLDFGGADLRGAALSRATLIGARLGGANLTDADLLGAQFDHRTEWPPGFEPQEHGAVKVEWRSGACRLDLRHRELRAEAGRHWRASMARLRAGQARAAIRDLRRALPDAPSSPGETAYGLFLQGLISTLKRHTIKARAAFQQAISLYPHLAAAHVALAYVFLLRGKSDNAFAAYQEALRIDSHDRDLYLPLLMEFEQSESLKARFAAYAELLFPAAEQPLSPATVPNPVELFLDRQPDELEKVLCRLVLGELIDSRPAVVIPRYLRERRQWPAYVVQHFVSWLKDLAGPIPELPSVWEFLSGTGYEIECRIVDYQGRMEEQGFAREQIDRRMEIVQAFHKLCEELGYIRDDEEELSGTAPEC